MERNFLKYLEERERENARVSGIASLAASLNINFKEAESIIDNLVKEVTNPGVIQIQFETRMRTELKAKEVTNIVSVDSVTKAIVNRAIGELELYQVDNYRLDALKALVKEELKEALKKTKVIDAVEIKAQNEVLKKAYIELKKDRDRLKEALEGTLCGMVVYADTKGNEAAAKIIDSYRRRSGEALKEVSKGNR